MEMVNEGIAIGSRKLCIPFRSPSVWRSGTVATRSVSRAKASAVAKPLTVVTIVGGFATALALARETQLVATVPERHTEGLRKGMHSFPLPVAVPSFNISMLWHPRMDGDLAHRWLRGCVRSACGTRHGEMLDGQPSLT